MSMSDSRKDSASKLKSNDGDVCDVNNNMLNSMSTDCKDVVSVCANCGKEDDNLKSCTACKMVKYCNRECQIAHRPKHKKECKKRAAELYDKELFKQPPLLNEDCPICFLRMPYLGTGSKYKMCCGKLICSGCIYAPVYDNQGNIVEEKCPLCRTPVPTTTEEATEMIKKRVEAGDPFAIFNLACDYQDGAHGLPQDYNKAMELFHQAAELGYAKAYNSIGIAYCNGVGVAVDKKKSIHYFELAAMRGDTGARHNLSNREGRAGNIERALKHHTIAAGDGNSESLEIIKQLYRQGDATKEDYTKALQLYQVYLGEIKSDQRDKAAAAHNGYRYY